MIDRLAPIMLFKIVYYALEQCSKIKRKFNNFIYNSIYIYIYIYITQYNTIYTNTMSIQCPNETLNK